METTDTRVGRLEWRLRRLVRVNFALAALLIVVVGAAAVLPNDLVVLGRVEVKDDQGVTRITLFPDGKATVGGDIDAHGNLDVKGRLTLNGVDVGKALTQVTVATPEAVELKVAEIVTSFAPGLHPNHRFWAVTRGGVVAPVTTDLSKEPEANALVHAAALSESFGDEVIASWVTPINVLHEMITPPTSSIGRIETKVVGKSKVVAIVASVGSREPSVFGAKIFVVYRERKR